MGPVRAAVGIEYVEFEEERDGGDELEEGVNVMCHRVEDDYEDSGGADSTEDLE